jgi:thiamine-monophosphate kinase
MGERELLKKICDILSISDEDAFVFPMGDMLGSLTIDTLVGETDVPSRMTPFQIGWKSVIMNVSDLAAMGSRPLYFLCSFTLPVDYPVLELVTGIEAGCDTYACEYSGGDINEGTLTISGVALGVSETVMVRSGARAGDRVGITGDVGRVYAGFQDPDQMTDAIGKKIFSPQARVSEGLSLRAHSCIDVSDGLSSELHHIADDSRVRIDINSEKIPIHEDVRKMARSRGESPVEWALKSGEEYELLYTDSKISTGTHIGDVSEGTGVFLDGDPLPITGWEHFTTKK